LTLPASTDARHMAGHDEHLGLHHLNAAER